MSYIISFTTHMYFMIIFICTYMYHLTHLSIYRHNIPFFLYLNQFNEIQNKNMRIFLCNHLARICFSRLVFLFILFFLYTPLLYVKEGIEYVLLCSYMSLIYWWLHWELVLVMCKNLATCVPHLFCLFVCLTLVAIVRVIFAKKINEKHVRILLIF